MMINPFTMDIFKEYMKFCCNCGQKLDLPFKDFHFPLCFDCRLVVMNKIMRDNWDSGLDEEYKIYKKKLMKK